MVAYFRGGVLIGVQLKRHNLGQLMEFISGNSRHTKDVLIVGQFWWWTYGLGTISARKENTFWRSLLSY